MTFRNQAMLAVLLLALVSTSTTVGAEETDREARIEATIPRSGFFMVAGFDSVWMMDLATNKLIRIHPDDNSVTEIPFLGAVGCFAGAGMAAKESFIGLIRLPIRSLRQSTSVPTRVPSHSAAIAVGRGFV